MSVNKHIKEVNIYLKYYILSSTIVFMAEAFFNMFSASKELYSATISLLFLNLWISLFLYVVYFYSTSGKLFNHLGGAPTEHDLIHSDTVVASNKGTVLELFLLLFLLFIISNDLYSNGIIAGQDWVYLGDGRNLASSFPFPSLWTFNGLGSDNLFGSPTYLIWGIMGFLAKLGVAYSVSERLIFLFPIFLCGYFGTTRLLKHLHVDKHLIPVLGIFFCFNTFTFDWYDGGWFTILLGYSIIPLIILNSIKFLQTSSINRALLLGFLLGMEGWCDFRENVILGVIALCSLSSKQIRSKVSYILKKEHYKKVIAIPIIALSLQMNWILPYMLSSTKNLSSFYTDVGQLKTFSLMTIQNTLGIFDLWWPKLEPFKWYSTYNFSFVLLPLVIIFGMFRINKKNMNNAMIFLLITLLGSAIATGTNGIFHVVNSWIYTHVPTFNLFRYPLLLEQITIIGFILFIGICHQIEPRYNLVIIKKPMFSIDYAGLWFTIIAISLINVITLMPAATSSLPGNFKSHSSSTVRQIEARISFLPPGSVLWIPGLPTMANQNVVVNADLNHHNISESTTVLGPGFAQLVQNYLAAPLSKVDFERNSDVAKLIINQYKISYVVIDSLESVYDQPYLQKEIVSETSALKFKFLFSNRTYKVYGIDSHSLVESYNPTNTHFRNQIIKRSYQQPQNVDNYLSKTLKINGIYNTYRNCGSKNCIIFHAKSGIAQTHYSLHSLNISDSSIYCFNYDYKLNAGQARITIPEIRNNTSIYLQPTSNIWLNSSCSTLLLGSTLKNGFSIELLSSESLNGPQSSDSLLMKNFELVNIGRTTKNVIPNIIFSQNKNNKIQTYSSGIASRYLIKSNHSKFEIHLSKPYRTKLIVLWQNYNPGWRANIKGSNQKLNHLKINGWANGWEISTKADSQVVLINYSNQNYLNYGMLISYAGLISLICYLLLYKFRKIYKQKLNK